VSGATIGGGTRWGARAALLCAFASAVLAARLAPAQTAREYEVKAAVLYNFARFVEWPEGSFRTPDDPIVLAVAGDDPFGAALEHAIEGQTAQGRRFTVRRFQTREQLEACHILFVGSSEDHLGWLAALARRQSVGVLTVGEGRRFARRGTVAFLIDDRRIQLAVNLESVAAARLRVSSKLLALATIVSSDERDD
jgi:hypothetical protein